MNEVERVLGSSPEHRSRTLIRLEMGALAPTRT
jgi:hypothetical protein